MGLWEQIKRRLGYVDDDAMVYETSTDELVAGISTLKAGLRWPWKKLIWGPNWVPPGWVVGPNGKLYPQVTTGGIFPVTEASAATISAYQALLQADK